MKKLLIILCAALMGYAASNASVIVGVTEDTFDGLVNEFTENDQYVVVIDKSFSHGGANAVHYYIFFKDGFYYRMTRQGNKAFDNPRVTVVPITFVTSDAQTGFGG